MNWESILGLIILFIVMMVYFSRHQSKIKESKAAYDKALESKDISKIIEAGRKYYSVLRPPNSKNSGFDAETAIQNDIKAAGL